MLFRHSEAFLFIRFGPVLPLQHHAPPTLSHRPFLSFHSTPVPLLPLIHSAPPGPPAAPLRLSCSPSPHSIAIFPIHSFRSASSSPPPASAPPLRSILHLQYRPTLLADTTASRLSSLPDLNTVGQRHSNPSKKQKNGEARAANPNPPGRMPITSPPSPVFSTFPNDDSETLCTMSQLLTRNSSLPPDAHGLETLFRTARCLRKGTNNCRVL